MISRPRATTALFVALSFLLMGMSAPEWRWHQEGEGELQSTLEPFTGSRALELEIVFNEDAVAFPPNEALELNVSLMLEPVVAEGGSAGDPAGDLRVTLRIDDGPEQEQELSLQAGQLAEIQLEPLDSYQPCLEEQPPCTVTAVLELSGELLSPADLVVHSQVSGDWGGYGPARAMCQNADPPPEVLGVELWVDISERPVEQDSE